MKEEERNKYATNYSELKKVVCRERRFCKKYKVFNPDIEKCKNTYINYSTMWSDFQMDEVTSKYFYCSLECRYLVVNKNELNAYEILYPKKDK